ALPGDTLPLRPGDELLEAVDRRRRRRDVARHLVVGGRTEEREAVAGAKLAQHDTRAAQHRESPLPDVRGRLDIHERNARQAGIEGNRVLRGVLVDRRGELPDEGHDAQQLSKRTAKAQPKTADGPSYAA